MSRAPQEADPSKRQDRCRVKTLSRRGKSTGFCDINAVIRRAVSKIEMNHPVFSETLNFRFPLDESTYGLFGSILSGLITKSSPELKTFCVYCNIACCFKISIRSLPNTSFVKTWRALFVRMNVINYNVVSFIKNCLFYIIFNLVFVSLWS